MALTTLIFDLDGTLIDSAPDLRTACNKVLATKGRREITLQETTQFVGNGAAKLVERAFRTTGDAVSEDEIPALTEAFLAFYDGHEADETTIYEGVEQTLQKLKDQGYRMGLCTNKPYIPTINLMKDLGLGDFFEVMIGGDQVATKKPHPEMIHKALADMGVDVADAIMIGDSPNDIGAAKNAGLRNVAVSYGYRKVPVEALEADVVIDQMSDLPRAINSLT
ncbi:phosphoglycolate phosphatase [Terasakiella sp. A23]|uniref:phosphoglycolate phosphatase n=1 Tax=Terasakiella sp. FCG-A23 TaxID=3080561 RepID=UPI0029539CA7|nr:phosphoglycolate phosphatase [Terasakiella sp. A23]MDV7338336.1 phosphoglycolate phosphatase [Terasakiella sp. A23]